MANITPILDKGKVKLEKKATERFGAAVENFKRGGLESLSPGEEFVDPTGIPIPTSARGDGTFYASSYAAALAGGTSFRPKMKLLFKVEFVFTPEAQAAFPDFLRAQGTQDFTFLVKSVDRPKIDFDYEDDINMYNFRTRALRRIKHRELTITFMDDVGNRVLNFFRALMMIHSPITRRQLQREKLEGAERLRPPDTRSINSGNGMMFAESPADIDTNDTAIRGVFNSEVGGVIQTIRVKQMYVDPSAPLGSAMQEVIFDFMNAKLVSFDLDDLNHDVSDVNLMTLQFDYDWMEIIDVGPLQEADSPIYNITVPGITNAPIDVSPGTGGAGNDAASGGRGNPFASVLRSSSGTLSSAESSAHMVSAESIERALEMNPGMGLNVTTVGKSGSNVPSGIVGAATQNLTSGFNNSYNAGGGAAAGLAAADQSAAGTGTGTSRMKNLILPPWKSNQASTTVMDSALGGPVDLAAVVPSKNGGV